MFGGIILLKATCHPNRTIIYLLSEDISFKIISEKFNHYRPLLSVQLSIRNSGFDGIVRFILAAKWKLVANTCQRFQMFSIRFVVKWIEAVKKNK